jgi:hypothetical protein
MVAWDRTDVSVLVNLVMLIALQWLDHIVLHRLQSCMLWSWGAAPSCSAVLASACGCHNRHFLSPDIIRIRVLFRSIPTTDYIHWSNHSCNGPVQRYSTSSACRPHRLRWFLFLVSEASLPQVPVSPLHPPTRVPSVASTSRVSDMHGAVCRDHSTSRQDCTGMSAAGMSTAPPRNDRPLATHRGEVSTGM